MIDASVIIPARDAAATLGVQLDALEAQRFSGGLEVIVADNASRDSTALIVKDRQRSWPALHLINVNGEGACRARNMGAHNSSGRAILFCDADDLVGDGWCDAMMTTLEEYDAVGGAMDLAKLNPDDRVDDLLRRQLDRWPGYQPFAWASNFGIRSDVFTAVGGFDELFSGCDDEELSWRLVRLGYTLGFAPPAVVHYRLPPAAQRCRKAFHYAIDEPHLYRHNRAHGMPTGAPLWRWAGRLAKRVGQCCRHPRSAAARTELCQASARLLGCLVGSIKYRRWFLGP